MSSLKRSIRTLAMFSLLFPAGFLRAGFAGTDLVVPAVARSTGLNGSAFYSSVYATNLTSTDVAIQVKFYENGRSNSAPVSFSDTLAAAETKRYDNVVQTLFGLTETSGALRITSTGDVLVSSRTFNLPASGRLDESQGLFFSAVPASFSIGAGETTHLQGVSQGSGENFRYNFGFVETAGQPARIRFMARAEMGEPLGAIEVDGLPFERRQFSASELASSLSTSNARIEATVLSGGGRVIVYGTQIANLSNDSAGFEMSFPAPSVPPGDCSAIQQAIDALPSAGGSVQLSIGTYTCSEPVVIDRDDVELRGRGPATVLRLADGANAPVLVLGQKTAAPTVTRRNIVVADLAIDGNREAQTSECYRGPCAANPLRNNGVSLRRVEDTRVERIRIRGARSGGLVSELVCRRLTVRDVVSADNYFDGMAGYETEESLFSGIKLVANAWAGLSLDNAFNRNILSDIVITKSTRVGVFMREARDNVFVGLQVRGSGEHGLYLAQQNEDPSKQATGNTFSGLVVADSAGCGIRVNDATCVNNLLIGAQLVSNLSGSICEPASGILTVLGAIRR